MLKTSPWASDVAICPVTIRAVGGDDTSFLAAILHDGTDRPSSSISPAVGIR